MDKILEILERAGFTGNMTKAVNVAFKMLGEYSEETVIEETSHSMVYYLLKNKNALLEICREIAVAMNIKADENYEVTEEDKLNMIIAMLELRAEEAENDEEEE